MNPQTFSLAMLPVLFVVFAFGGCSDFEETPPSLEENIDDPHFIETHSHALIGGADYDSATCDASDQAFLDTSHTLMRQALASRAFEECVERTMRTGFNGRGPYRECNDTQNGIRDPFFGRSITDQIAGVLAATRTVGNLHMTCDGAAWEGSAQASVGRYYASDGEAMIWNGGGFWWWHWRFMKNVGDFHGTVGLMVHEALHQQGYLHDDCTNQSSYSYKDNSVPYIVQWCARDTLNKSNSCSAMNCGSTGKAISINADNIGGCECVHEMDHTALGFIDLDSSNTMRESSPLIITGRPLHTPANVRNDDPSVFRYSPDVDVVAVGQFDGAGGEDLLLRDSASGDLLILSRRNNRYETLARWSGFTQKGSWWLWNSDIISDVVGDFDGIDQGREEFIIQDSNGFAMVGLTSNNTFRILKHWRIGDQLGNSNNWLLAHGDTIEIAGDFLEHTNDPNLKGDEVLIQKNDGALVLISLHQDSFGNLGAWAPVATARGDRFGHWVIDSGNTFVGAGRITTTDHAQLLIRSSWGIAVLDMQEEYDAFGCATTACKNSISPVMISHGSELGVYASSPWVLSSNDRYSQELIADYDGDGKDEIIVRSGSAMAMLDNIGWVFVGSIARVNLGQSLNGWSWSPSDWMAATGNMDGSAGDEVAIFSNWGSGVLTYNTTNRTFKAHDLRSKRSLIGLWSVPDETLNTNLDVHAIADVDGDGRSELVMERLNTRHNH